MMQAVVEEKVEERTGRDGKIFLFDENDKTSRFS
jgi:hypothetical protein